MSYTVVCPAEGAAAGALVKEQTAYGRGIGRVRLLPGEILQPCTHSEKELPSSGTYEEEDHTTVMVLNIPNQISTKVFLDKLKEGPFCGTYNFCYIPRVLSTGKNLGFAFVNFETAAWAQKFSKEWAGTAVFSKGRKLKLKPAKIQGIKANVRSAEKSMKRRNSAFKPLLTF